MTTNDTCIISNIRIVSLTDGHNLESFCCGNTDLDNFLKNCAIAEQEYKVSRTYLTCLHNETIGFFTLSASGIEVLAIDAVDSVKEFSESIYPAIDIHKLAVTEKFQGRGVGRYALNAAIGKILYVSEHIGCRYITLDSVKNKIGFYRKHGFKIVDIYKDDEYVKMYLNIAQMDAASVK
jgi:GNAT superfamily N-acetyltransferase